MAAALGGTETFGITYPDAAVSPGRAVPPLRREDLKLQWGLDFHYPRGILPLAHELVATLAASSRVSAETLPAVSGRGLECRVIGPHVYTAGVPVLDAGERAGRAHAALEELATFPETFAATWSDRVQELDSGFSALRALDLTALTVAELKVAFDRAISHYNQAWAIHFDLMYPLLAVAESFREMCRGVGIPVAQSADLVSICPTSVHRADAALRSLANSVCAARLESRFMGGAPSYDALRDDPDARGWMVQFSHFVTEHGERSDAIVDVGSPAWSDDPNRVLSLIADLLRENAFHPTKPRLARVEAQRARRRRDLEEALSPRDRAAFREALARVEAADFAWWNEDHNTYIDLRAHLPVARVAAELVTRFGLRPPDSLFLFAEEIRGLGDDALDADRIPARRRFHGHWRDLRTTLPRSLGTAHPVNDPVLAEIVGMPPAGGSNRRTLRGIGTASGIARGPARVVRTPDDFAKIQTGDILVCEATSPSWTFLFPRLAGCVCDAGGLMTHAAIICREYGLPCVAGIGEASQVLVDGEPLEIDGTTGTVRRLS